MQKCVLIYDDDSEILMLCKMILQKEGYRVETRSTCNSIADDIESWKPDVVLMDLWIPQIGGESAIEQIREHPVSGSIPILLFSANDDIGKITEKSQANGYIQKPFDIHEFKKEIKKWL